MEIPDWAKRIGWLSILCEQEVAKHHIVPRLVSKETRDECRTVITERINPAFEKIKQAHNVSDDELTTDICYILWGKDQYDFEGNPRAQQKTLQKKIDNVVNLAEQLAQAVQEIEAIADDEDGQNGHIGLFPVRLRGLLLSLIPAESLRKSLQDCFDQLESNAGEPWLFDEDDGKPLPVWYEMELDHDDNEITESDYYQAYTEAFDNWESLQDCGNEEAENQAFEALRQAEQAYAHKHYREDHLQNWFVEQRLGGFTIPGLLKALAEDYRSTHVSTIALSSFCDGNTNADTFRIILKSFPKEYSPSPALLADLHYLCFGGNAKPGTASKFLSRQKK